jgi:hypothetical protein
MAHARSRSSGSIEPEVRMTLTGTRNRMFIHGDWADSETVKTTQVINPAPEEMIDSNGGGGPGAGLVG